MNNNNNTIISDDWIIKAKAMCESRKQLKARVIDDESTFIFQNVGCSFIVESHL